MEFVALDFETANASRNSACSIGLVTLKDGRVGRILPADTSEIFIF